MRSVLYRFPDLADLERTMRALGEEMECELAIPPGEPVEEGEWVLAIFELGDAGRATSAAGRAITSQGGARLAFEPRDWCRLVEFVRREAPGALPAPPHPTTSPCNADRVDLRGPTTARSRTATPPHGHAAPTVARVLMVDDDADIRDVVSAMLDAVGLFVVAVASAEEAIDRIQAEGFDLLVLDWNLPKMTGLDLCRFIRKQPGLEALPVLFLTANACSQDMVKAFACGGDDYVAKPFRAPELGARIFSLLRRVKR